MQLFRNRSLFEVPSQQSIVQGLGIANVRGSVKAVGSGFSGRSYRDVQTPSSHWVAQTAGFIWVVALGTSQTTVHL